MGFEFNFDPQVFEKIGAETKKALVQALALTSDQCVSETKKHLTWDHGLDLGELRNSYTWTMNAEGEIKVAELEGENVSRLPAPGAARGEFAVNIGTPLIRGAYLEYGTRAHWPPIQALIDWVHHKGIAGSFRTSPSGKITRSKSNEQQTADKAMAFVIARSISRKGTRALPHLFPGVEAGIAFFEKLLRQEINAARIK